MARSEYESPELGDLQSGCSWIPTTPVKPISVNQQGIHTNWQENQYMHSNLTNAERVSGAFLGEAQYHNIPVSCATANPVGSVSNTWQGGGAGNSNVYCDALSGFDIWQTNGESSSRLYGENSRVNEKFSINEVSGWANMSDELSFMDLLALADKKAASMRNAIGNAHFASTSNVSDPCLYAQQSSRSIPTFGNAVPDLNRWPREKFVAETNDMQNVLMDGRSVPCLPWFDPNSVSTPATNEASRKSGPSQFEPTTPAKTSQAGPTNDSAATQDLSTCDVPAGEQLQENHNFDKGGTEEAEFIRTPQPKPKRRKHRPKVVIQDQVKRTPKAQQKNPPANPGPTPPKRKYVRRKGVNVEGQTNGIDLTKQASTPIGTPVAKRKYTRRKGVEKSEVNMAKEAAEADGQNSSIRTGSCRRSLNFNSDAQVRDETVQQSQGKEVMMERNAHELAQSDIPVTSIKVDPLHGDSWPDNPSGCAKGKCQIVFSDVTHDKEEINVRAMIFQDGKWMPRSDTFSSNSLLTPIGQGISLKRQHVVTSASEAEPRIPNATCTFYNSWPTRLSGADESESTSGVHFPAAHKSKESVKRFDPATNQGYSAVRFDGTDLQRSIPAFQGTQSAQQIFGDLLASEPEKKVRKRKARASIQHDLSSLPEVLAKSPVTPCRTVKKTKTIQEIDLNASCKVFGGHTFPTPAIKKPAKRRVPVNSTTHNVYIHQEFASTSMGSALGWMSLVDSIADQLGQLSLNSEGRHISLQNQQYGALVPYQRGGAVVLYDEKVKKRKSRAKIDLDDETSRVWRLLLENIDSEGIDGTDEEKMKYWEEERRVFTGRAQSFIARMHLIQGDRRFSPWKGSVVDSVVGVFLTQNVSDHLSSSAFMSMASRFPPKPMMNPTEIHEAEVSNTMKEPLIFLLDSDETVESSKVLLKPVCAKDEKSPEDIEDEQIIINATKSVESASNKSTSLNADEPDTDEAISSQTSVITFRKSPESRITDKIERTESSSPSNSEEELATVTITDNFTESVSFLKLLEMAGKKGLVENLHVESERLVLNSQVEDLTLHSKTNMSHSNPALCMSLDFGEPCNLCTNSGKQLPATERSGLSVDGSAQKLHLQNSVESASETAISSNELHESTSDNSNVEPLPKIAENQIEQVPDIGIYPQNLMDVTSSSSNIDNSRKFEHNEVKSKKNESGLYSGETSNTPKSKGARKGKEKVKVNWDALRKEAQKDGKKERTINQMDSLDWEAVRRADVNEIANAIKERGMNNVLAERIQAFLERLVEDHESIDLEWLRDVEPDKAKEFLLSFRGLGLKSVECVRLLTLHHLAFPVDTNVARIAVRLGWAPLQPLPESLQLHLLELYPIMESIQKYLWPRLCKLDQKMLYELHYQMITFGKVFCTKSKPNCNACPMRGECRHFASAFASARLALPAPEDKSIIGATENKASIPDATRNVNLLELPSPQADSTHLNSGASSNTSPIIEQPKTPEPIIEVPATPEPECTQGDIEDAFYEDPDEIPTIHLNMEEFTQNLQTVMQQQCSEQEGSLSRALVTLTPEAASIPVPKLKNVSRLRTEHQVYQLPDDHPLLEGWDRREPDDPFPYLLAIWTPGETADSIAPPERRCSINLNDSEALCSDEACLYCNSIRESKSRTVRGTLLIPCRTAMKGSFPLNGTYFQVNEVFSDHESSLEPIEVPRQWLWNLQRRTVHFGTSIPTIFKGQTMEQIQNCFWRGFVCVRGFDRKSRAPRPLMARLHFHKTTKAEKGAPANKTGKGKGKTNASIPTSKI